MIQTLKRTFLLFVIVLISSTITFSSNHYSYANTIDEGTYTFGEAENLGPAALAAKAQGVAIGDGEVYYAINGDPARFYAADADTGEVLYTESLPNSDVVWGMTVGSDGNIYFSGTFDGILYRYNVQERTLDKVGKNPSDAWVWQLKSTLDGKIYGATYPNAKVFEYDIETETFIDLGTFKEGQEYARGIGVTDEYLYVGIGTTASLHQMNRETGERKEIKLPITDEQTSISNVWEYNGYLFIAYGTSLLTYDIMTEEVVHEMYWEDLHTFDGLISSPSPYDDNIIYFRDKQTGELWTYDMAAKEIQAVEPKIALPGSALKDIRWIKDENGQDVLAMLHHQLEYSIYNPITNELSVSYPEAEMEGLTIQSMEFGPDNLLYIGGYQGSFGIFNPEDNAYILQERDPHQVEGIGFINDKVYLGTYGGARIFEFNPNEAFDYTDGKNTDNPKMVYGIPDEQSRPFTFTSSEDKLFVGTISDYGKLGGSLAQYDVKTDTWTSKRNIVEDQSIIGLAHDDGIIYGGTTIAGGLGIAPTQDAAKMFTYTISSDTYEVFSLSFDHMDKPTMIGELSMGPDGLLWGIAFGKNNENEDSSTIFAMDTGTKEIVKSKEIYVGETNGSNWRPFYMRWDANDNLFTTAGRKLSVISPDTLEVTQILEGNVEIMDIDKDGNIFYANGPNLYKLPVTYEKAEIVNEITSILPFDAIQVDQGTQLDNLTLPSDVQVSLDNGDVVSLAVSWNLDDTNYDGSIPGEYIINGTLQLDEEQSISNSANIQPTQTIKVNKIDNQNDDEENNEDDEIEGNDDDDTENNDDSSSTNDNSSHQNEQKQEGNKLPKTATNIGNVLIIGLIVLFIALSLLFISRIRKNIE